MQVANIFMYHILYIKPWHQNDVIYKILRNLDVSICMHNKMQMDDLVKSQSHKKNLIFLMSHVTATLLPVCFNPLALRDAAVTLYQKFYKTHIKDITIWRHRTGSTLDQAMPCCTKPLPEPMLTYHQ